MDPELREFETAALKRRSLGFVGVLAVLLAAMGAVVVEQAYPKRPGFSSSSGEIRPIPPEALRQQLRSGRLSDRQADYWRVEEPVRPR